MPDKVLKMKCSICDEPLMYKIKEEGKGVAKVKIAVVGPCLKCAGEIMRIAKDGGSDG